MKRKLDEVNYVVFDIETTGLDPEKEQIIEIGAVKVNATGEELDHFHKFIQLYKRDSLPPFIVDLTTITDQELEEKGEVLDDVMSEFLNFIADGVLVAQNAKFDMSFLEYYYLRYGTYIDNLVIDTMDIAKYLYPEKDKYRLSSLVEYFDVDYDSDAHHRADYDAKITAKVLVKELDLLRREVAYNSIEGYQAILRLEEATLKQKRFLFSLLEKNNISILQKTYLSKSSASCKIDALMKK